MGSDGFESKKLGVPVPGGAAPNRLGTGEYSGGATRDPAIEGDLATWEHYGIGAPKLTVDVIRQVCIAAFNLRQKPFGDVERFTEAHRKIDGSRASENAHARVAESANWRQIARRVGSDDEYDRRRRGCGFACLRRRNAGPYDRGDLPAHEIGSQSR